VGKCLPSIALHYGMIPIHSSNLYLRYVPLDTFALVIFIRMMEIADEAGRHLWKSSIGVGVHPEGSGLASEP
jgi:hypothetical protein